MISYQVAKVLRISKGNLKYYVARYANHLDWSEDDTNDLARIILFRKLGFPHFWIQNLRKGKYSIQEAFESCPRAKKHIIEADQEWLQKWRWEELPFAECTALIHKNALPTPKQDVFFWGRMFEWKVGAVVLGILLAGAFSAFQGEWGTCMFRISYLFLVPVYCFGHVILDNWVWRKRIENAKKDPA